MSKPTYSLSEAARVARVSEDELRCAIQEGLLRARFLQTTGEYQISSADMTDYMTQARTAPLPSSPPKKKVLIIDDEINFANIMKLELERDPRIEAKFATWGKDGIAMAERYGPDLCLIDFMLPDITGDEVLAALHLHRRKRNARMVVYSAHTRDAIKGQPNLEERLSQLGADEFLSKSAGMRALIAKCYALLGLEQQPKTVKRQG